MHSTHSLPLLLRSSLLLLSLLSLSTLDVYANSDALDWHGEVLDLNDGNFLENLSGREVVVAFVAPWCRQCTSFKPTLHAWAEALAREPSGIHNVVVAQVDCTLNPETSSAQQIQAFPTLRFFRNGKALADYLQDRTIDRLTSWVEDLSKQSGAPAAPQQQQQTPTQQQKKQQQQSGKQPRGQAKDSSAEGGLLPGLWHLKDFTDAKQIKRSLSDLIDVPLVGRASSRHARTREPSWARTCV